jgi:colicin import membrane protein
MAERMALTQEFVERSTTRRLGGGESMQASVYPRPQELVTEDRNLRSFQELQHKERAKWQKRCAKLKDALRQTESTLRQRETELSSLKQENEQTKLSCREIELRATQREDVIKEYKRAFDDLNATQEKRKTTVQALETENSRLRRQLATQSCDDTRRPWSGSGPSLCAESEADGKRRLEETRSLQDELRREKERSAEADRTLADLKRQMSTLETKYAKELALCQEAYQRKDAELQRATDTYQRYLATVTLSISGFSTI